MYLTIQYHTSNSISLDYELDGFEILRVDGIYYDVFESKFKSAINCGL